VSDLPSGWALARFTDVVKNLPTAGHVAETNEIRASGSVPVITQGDASLDGYIDDFSRTYTTGLPLIIFGDHTRAVKLSRKPFAVGPNAKVLSVSGGLNPDFLYHQFPLLLPKSRGYGRHYQFLAKSDVAVAPAAEQERIVAAIEEQFSRLDAGVAALERVRQNLKRMRASILAHEFSSIAVTAPRVPGRDLFSFVTSGSRGWATYYSVEGSLFLRIGNIPRSGIDLDLHDLQRVQPPANAEGTRTQVHAGDVLISITADLGRVAVVPPTFETAYINQHVALARPKSGIEARYLAWYLASPKGLQQWDKLRRGATKIGLGLDDIRAIDVPMPSVEIQKVTADRIDRGWIAVQAAESEVSRAVHRMDALRSAVLSGAFSGKLVPQDPSDEPASVLLERIAIDRWSSHGHKLRKLSARQEALL
jgi:Type I restriction modification DNA specificity domain